MIKILQPRNKKLSSLSCYWYLSNKLNNYIQRNKKYPPLARLEYYFLRDLYRYLTKQILRDQDKQRIFDEYQKLVNICYFPNKPEIDKTKINLIYNLSILLIERDYSGPYTFIQLNDNRHYKKLIEVIELFYNWAINDNKGNYMNQKEFWENMEFIRNEFNKFNIDLNYQVGKWPRNLRKRFNRESKDDIFSK